MIDRPIDLTPICPLILFVAPEGSDTDNSGRTPAEPFRTIEHAVIVANIGRRGAVLILAPGDYSRKSPQ